MNEECVMTESKITTTLNSVFNTDSFPVVNEDIEDTNDYIPVVAESKADDEDETNFDNHEIRNDVVEDYDSSRNNLKRLISKGEHLLDSAMAIADATEDPKAIRAANEILSSLTNVNKELLQLTKTKQDVLMRTKTKEFMKDVMSSGNVQNINTTNNSIFVGTPNELHKMLQEVKNNPM